MLRGPGRPICGSRESGTPQNAIPQDYCRNKAPAAAKSRIGSSGCLPVPTYVRLSCLTAIGDTSVAHGPRALNSILHRVHSEAACIGLMPGEFARYRIAVRQESLTYVHITTHS